MTMPEMPSIRAEDLLAELGWMRTLARSLVRDVDQAEDLTQDTCVAALQNAPRDTSRLRPWLARIARNLAHQQVRAVRARRPGRPVVAAAAMGQAVAVELLEQALRRIGRRKQRLQAEQRSCRS